MKCSVKTPIVAASLVLAAWSTASAAPAKWSHRAIKPGRVALPLNVHVGGKSVKATFTGVARPTSLGMTIQQPRIVAQGKKYYVSHTALRTLFSDFSAGNSGQTIVWGDLTRNPNKPRVPALRPPMIDVAGGKLAPAKKQTKFIDVKYFAGPWGYLGKKAAAQDFIGFRSTNKAVRK